MKGRVLLVDDDRDLCETLTLALGKRGFQTTWSQSAAGALAILADVDPDVIVTDLNLGGPDGLELCRRANAARPDVPVVIITAFASLETAIGGIRAGAWDFITKPFDVDTIVVVLDRAVQVARLRAEVRRLRSAAGEGEEASGVLGESPPIRRLRDLITRVAGTDVTALVTGESGAGKEIVAHAIHGSSSRARGPFVAVNCAAMPESLLESELFGHVRGAFTDAKTARSGLFLQASGGTLFLDEIGELPLILQAKLLRAVQERSVRPLGGDREVTFDARLVFATNRDLAEEVEQGRFREDLYFRINVVEIPVPPLRSRLADVLLLAQHFIARSAARFTKPVHGMSPDVAERLLAYDWPGNVRELQNAMERAVALTHYSDVTVDDLPERIRAWRPTVVLPAIETMGDLVTLLELEVRYIRRVIDAVEGNKAAAARVLGIDRRTLYRKLGREDPEG